MASEGIKTKETEIPKAIADEIPQKFNYLKNKVALVKLDDYKPENIRQALKKIIDLLGINEFFKDKSIFLKPNLLAPTKNAFTPTEYTLEVAKLLETDLNCKEISIGDSSLTKTITNLTLNKCEINKECGENEYKAVNFFESEREKIPLKNPYYESEEHIYLPKEIITSDIVINLPKLKTHKGYVYTGAIKNLFGLLGNKMNMHMTHKEKDKFQKMLADIYFAVEETNKTELPKVLTIMDAVIAMEGNGPRNGKPKKVGLLVAGFNSAAVDIVGYTLMNGDPKDLDQITSLAKRTALPVDINQLELVGENYKDYIVKDFKKPKISTIKDPVSTDNLFGRIASKAMSISIKINNKKCILCQQCVKHCPAQAMEKRDNRIIINEDKCVECFCCGESCQSDAISVKWYIFRHKFIYITILALLLFGIGFGIWVLIVFLLGFF